MVRPVTGAGGRELLAVAPDVARALAGAAPVVALETTLVTHGFPPAEGLEVAALMSEAVRKAGAVPAVIGVLEGRLHVGLGTSDLVRLARGADKLSLGNLAGGVAAGRAGSTTVAATLFAAHRAGISVFATGGIGGVHRGAQETGDVSADITALSRWPVAVVCSGAKAVLDLPRTVEALETLGVPVYGSGCDRFPAFYRRDSGLPVDGRFDTVADLAAAVSAHFALGIGSGVVVANPIPAQDEVPAALYEAALAQALRAAQAAGVRGREVTPFLLESLRDATDGRSAAANRALLIANARLAGALAVELAKRRA